MGTSLDVWMNEWRVTVGGAVNECNEETPKRPRAAAFAFCVSPLHQTLYIYKAQ